MTKTSAAITSRSIFTEAIVQKRQNGHAKTMTAAVLYGKEDVRIETVAVPEVGPGEVRVRIESALTCGTDVKVFRRGYHAKMIRPPAVFGHEFAGVIEAVGEGVEGWQVGQRVIAANSAPCGECFYCRRHLAELCEDLLFLNGAYAEYITVPARIVEKNLLPLPDHLSAEEAALMEPLACVVRGMEEVPVEAGENQVQIHFARTRDRTIGGYISFLTVILILGVILFERRAATISRP